MNNKNAYYNRKRFTILLIFLGTGSMLLASADWKIAVGVLLVNLYFQLYPNIYLK